MDNEFNEWLESYGLPKKPNKSCALNQFFKSLIFVKENKTFRIGQLQRYLKCGYGTTCKVIDALSALCVIQKTESAPNKFIR